MFKYLFGPVPSRRLGWSLGVDLVPLKVCSFDCIYCEVGRTNRKTMLRKEYVPTRAVKEELFNYFLYAPNPDYITLSGSGEPTLHAKIEEIIFYIKEKRPLVPLAVLTNGSMFFDASVRNGLMKADIVLPSLDAGTDQTFNKTNRPIKGYTLKNHIDGLVKFREEYKGKIWLEVFILPGYNDSAEDLENIKKAIELIQPDKVQLNSLDRPARLPGLQKASHIRLYHIKEKWAMDNIEIIQTPDSQIPDNRKIRGTRDMLIRTIDRRPCTLKEISRITGKSQSEILKNLVILESEGEVESKVGERGVFYTTVHK